LRNRKYLLKCKQQNQLEIVFQTQTNKQKQPHKNREEMCLNSFPKVKTANNY